MVFNLKKQSTNSKARAGVLSTDHGIILTPTFMPVGTQASIKGVHNHELTAQISSQIILCNTYHLYLRPQVELIQKAKGLHNFMNWKKPILTDSGGYQVYSLKGMRKINEEGVQFRSHIDGSRHFFTPENVIQIQRKLGADIIMAFDECTPYPCDKSYVKKSMHMTHRWLDRCLIQMEKTNALYGYNQIFGPIVQGGTYEELRKESAAFVAEKEQEINAIGGLSVGEPHNEMYDMTSIVTDILPIHKPRYLMGVGLPENILECIERGIDMFDCVLPTRNARHGLLYTWNGVINIKNAKWRDCFDPIDEDSMSTYSQQFSKAYLKHLFQVKEMLALQIASVHNLAFYCELVRIARKNIINNTFETWKSGVVKQITKRI